MTVVDVTTALSSSARCAVRDNNGEFSYAQLSMAAAQVANRLKSAINPAESRPSIALIAEPGSRWIVGVYAAWAAGFRIVPLLASHPDGELAHPLTDAECKIVLCCRATRPRAEQLQQQQLIQEVVDIDESWPTGNADQQHVELHCRPNEDALIVYTSGTTGKPKGVVHTFASLNAQIAGMVSMWKWTADDVIVSSLPLHHVHGIVNATLTSLTVGAQHRVLFPFSADKTWEQFAGGDITLFMAVPTMYTKLIDAWEQQSDDVRTRWSQGAANLRLMISGSAALPISTLEKWEAITGHVLLERYGMTEIGMALGNTLEKRVPGHVGMPFPGVEVSISSEGELRVKSAQVFDRYLNRPDATSESFRDGWFCTGDIAEQTPDGFKLLGRASVDIIKTGGEKVSALEIEEVFRQHPAVTDCAVVGLPDDEWGQRVAMAYTGEEIDADELRTWGKEQLAVAKVPTVIAYCAELPRNPMGKVVKPSVVDMLK